MPGKELAYKRTRVTRSKGNISNLSLVPKSITKLTKEIWELLILNGITTTVKYLSKALNRLADQESCYKVGSSE